MALRVLHLVGSAESEFFCDLSRLYAADCLEATADPSRYEFCIAYVTPDRQWRFPTDLSREAIAAARPVPLGSAVQRLVALGVDVAVPQMFCLPGMTHYRALLDLLGMPYVGNTPDVMAMTADKSRAKAVVAAAGVRVPEGEVLRRGDVPILAPPVVVKPVDADNSTGVALVRSSAEYPAALEEAFAHSDRVLVERYVELGREVRCGVLDRGGRLVPLPLEEYDVDTDSKPVRGLADKISRQQDGGLALVAKNSPTAWIVGPDDPLTQRVQDAATRCYAALGCRDYGLFDFRIDPAREPWFLEAGLYCSFARTSVIPVMAGAAGIELPQLFGEAVTQTMNRIADTGPT